jgi:hypothetical protein
MKKEIRTTTHIQADVTVVWAILTDFAAYPAWNPFVSALRGEVKVGNTIEVDLPGMTFKPVVTRLEPYKNFSWLGHLWIKGLFDGEHRFELTSHPDGTTTLVHSEQFQGLLVPLFAKQLDTKITQGFVAFNQQLKERAELKAKVWQQ